MTLARLQEILAGFGRLHITVVGDLFLDRWWEVDRSLDEPSVETGLTAYQVASRMTWDIKADSWEAFPLNQKWFATGEALAHLEYLMEAGQVAREAGPEGSARYVPQGK